MLEHPSRGKLDTVTDNLCPEVSAQLAHDLIDDVEKFQRERADIVCKIRAAVMAAPGLDPTETRNKIVQGSKEGKDMRPLAGALLVHFLSEVPMEAIKSVAAGTLEEGKSCAWNR